MVSTVATRTAKRDIDLALPPLENGDRLTQPEFHRRYLQYPRDVKFELVGGTVFMASPMRDPHSAYSAELGMVMTLYKGQTPGIRTGGNATVILDGKNEPQPDLNLRILDDFGGRSRLNEKQYIVGAPELLGEIAHSTVSLDLHLKKDNYQKAGVLEYIVICIEERKVLWFDLENDRLLKPDKDGITRSRVFPGLWLDTKALLEQNTSRLLEVLQQGLATTEHQTFIKRLQRKRKKRA
jgi:hypothetical protein